MKNRFFKFKFSRGNRNILATIRQPAVNVSTYSVANSYHSTCNKQYIIIKATVMQQFAFVNNSIINSILKVKV